MFKIFKNNMFFFHFLYLVFGILQVLSIAIDSETLRFSTRLVTPMVLLLIYLKSSKKRNFIFILALVSIFFSNFTLNFSQELWRILAIVFFVIYLLCSILIIINNTQKLRFFSILLGSIPFLTLLFYIIIITYDSLGIQFYPAIINAVLISIMGGISLSKYVFEDDAVNNSLLLSMMLFVFLVILYMLEHFYMNLKIFGVVRSIFYLSGHYVFLRYVLLSEKLYLNNI